jgi:hypothetical protein
VVLEEVSGATELKGKLSDFFVKKTSISVLAGVRDMERVEVVCRDLQFGADIGCAAEFRVPTRSKNAASALEYPRQVTDAVASWIKKGFAMGPVREEDLPAEAKVSGIMCRPKPDGGVRIILNLSSPAGLSVNDGIDSAEFPAKMSSTGKWLEVLEKAGRRFLMLKMDWSDAYKHIRVREEDLNLQWFSWLGVYFAELCLIFGATSSVGIYDRAAKVVLDIVLRISKFPRQLVCQHLDDVCAAAPEGSAGLGVFEKTYRDVAKQVGVRLAPTDDPDKAFSPCTAGTVLGVSYDTVAWAWAIPVDKLARVILQIEAALQADWLRQDEVWSLVGRIMHYAPLVPAGRFNLDYLILVNSESKDKGHLVYVHAQLKRQLHFWWLILRVTSGCSQIPSGLRMPAWTRECYTDAAGGTLESVGRGVGAVSLDWWAYVPWARKINCGVKAADGKKLSRKLSASGAADLYCRRCQLVSELVCQGLG